MAKLSDAMVKALRAIAENGAATFSERTTQALRRRFMIADAPGGFRITPTGAYALEQVKNAEAEAAYQAERASRPVPASAFVEPSAATPPVWGGEYDDDEDGPEGITEARSIERAAFRPAGEITTGRGDNGKGAPGPSVRLTPAAAGAKREATDAEVLQLLAMLDHGASVHRALYQEFGVLDAGPFRLNLEAVNRAAREAVRTGLATQAFVGRQYVLTAEPVHLVRSWDAALPETACGRYAGPGPVRARITTDPDKVTHERCKPSE